MLDWIINNVGAIATCLGAIVTAVGVLVGATTKHSKTSKVLVSMGNVISHLPSFIRTAEKLGGTGEDKKAYVLEQVLLYFRAEGVQPTEEQLASVSKQIDDQVKLTKDLHTNTKDGKYY